MKIHALENINLNWENIQSEITHGISGHFIAKTFIHEDIKIRNIEFSADYEADHWCEKGHIIFVLSGELHMEYNEGSGTSIPQGNSLILGDNISFHKAKTYTPTHIIIID